MKKRILALLLTLTMVLALIPAFSLTASAATEEIGNFGELESAIAAYGSANDDVLIAVNTEVDVTATLTIPANSNGKTLTITGETLTRKSGFTGNLFTVSTGAKLILENITIDGNGDPEWNNALVFVNGGDFALGNGATLINNPNCGVCINGGSFTMEGGEISGNASNGDGGGVYLNEGTFNLRGGKISGNTATWDGGGVYVGGGTFNLSGGEISGNTATGEGNGVCVSNGTFNLNGGIVTDIAGNFSLGGNVSLTEQLNITGNSTLDLNGNALGITVSSGNGIKIANGKTFTIEDGSEDERGTLTVVNTASFGNYGNGAGINTTGATFIINSGTVTATGRYSGAGIGGGMSCAGGTVTINGGTVTATGDSDGAGIGGGFGENGGTITINGGIVNAKGGNYARDIGSGNGGSGGTTAITGGSVFAANGKIDGFGSPTLYPVKVTVMQGTANVDGASITHSSYTNPAVTGGNLTSAFNTAALDSGVAYLWLPEGETTITVSNSGDSKSANYEVITTGANALTIALAYWKYDTASVTPEDDTYTITTPQELAWIAAECNGGNDFFGKTIVLANDINLDGKEWSPIGSNTKQFWGTFDGGGYTISGMEVNAPTADYQGLFGFVSREGTVKNVAAGGTVIGKSYVGGIAGRSNGTVQNCSFNGTITGSGSRIGGIVGENAGTVKNCFNTGAVIGGISSNGGIAGINVGSIINCYNSGNIIGGSQVGGIAEINNINATVNYAYFATDTANPISNGIKTDFGTATNVAGMTLDEMEDDDFRDTLNENKDDDAVMWRRDSSGVKNNGLPYVVPVEPIDIPAILGVTAPVRGQAPVATITPTAQYTGTVQWSDAPTTFAANTTYTATITLTETENYTLTGVTEDFFTVAGGTATNTADSGVVTVVFPATGSAGGTGGGGGGTTYYTVKFETNGGNTVQNQSIARNGKITKPADPTKYGFTFAGWYSDKELTKEYDFGAAVTGNVTIYAKWTEQEKSIDPVDPINPSEWQNPFTDVKPGDWFYGDVGYVYTNGLFSGTSENTFSPHTPMTRSMLVTVLWRMAGSPSVSGTPFTDVASGEWYSVAVSWAAQNGIASGIGGGKFAPDEEITREDMATILWRYAKFAGIDVSVGENTNILSYNDAFDISEYAIGGVQWACGSGVISGKSGADLLSSGLLDPQGMATRAEVAAMLHRFMETTGAE